MIIALQSFFGYRLSTKLDCDGGDVLEPFLQTHYRKIYPGHLPAKAGDSTEIVSAIQYDKIFSLQQPFEVQHTTAL